VVGLFWVGKSNTVQGFQKLALRGDSRGMKGTEIHLSTSFSLRGLVRLVDFLCGTTLQWSHSVNREWGNMNSEGEQLGGVVTP